MTFGGNKIWISLDSSHNLIYLQAVVVNISEGPTNSIWGCRQVSGVRSELELRRWCKLLKISIVAIV